MLPESAKHVPLTLIETSKVHRDMHMFQTDSGKFLWYENILNLIINSTLKLFQVFRP